MSEQSYKQNFFIVPSYVLDLPDITLGFLRVFETIFQFWNKNLPCFLSNASLQERTGLQHTQVNAALIFLESHKLLERKFIDGKRYLCQPLRIIETDCEMSDPTAPPGGGYRSTGRGGTGESVHKINKLNKEKEYIYTGDKSPKNNLSKNETVSKLKPVEYRETLYEMPENSKISYQEQQIAQTHGLTEEDLKTFAYFWEIYPKKVNKIKAQQAWFHDGCHKIAGHILQKLSEQVTKDDCFLTGYAPNPVNYIHGKRWEDDIQSKPKYRGGSSKKIDLDEKLNSLDWIHGVK